MSSVPTPHVVMSGLAFPESPRYAGGRFVVSDWGRGQVLALEPDGSTSVVAQAQSFPLCVDFLPDGRMLLVAGTTLLRQEPDGSLVTHADLTALGAAGWNDIVVGADGAAYVNTVGFDFPAGEFRPGSVALVLPDGSSSVVAEGLAFPNGMALSEDGQTLFVGESYGSCITSFRVLPDGGLSDRRVWAPTPGDHPDGICVDTESAVWYADVGNARCVRVAEGGAVLDVVDLDRGAFACVLGGPTRRTLYIATNVWDGKPSTASNGQVVTVEVAVPGAGRP